MEEVENDLDIRELGLNGQDAKPLIIGLPVFFLQELLIDSLDCFPVQSQMTTHILDHHDFADFEDIERQPFGHPHVRPDKIDLFGGNLLIVLADNPLVVAEYPDPRRDKSSSLKPIDSPCWKSLLLAFLKHGR